MKIPDLVFMSYNVSHARKNWPRPGALLKSNSAVKGNLNNFAELIKKHKVDVAGLQEIESKAFNDNANHVDILARESGLKDFQYGVHSNGINFLEQIDPVLNYASGTAILSGLPIIESFSRTFKNGKKFKKGYVAALINWPGAGNFIGISLHLDFSKKSNRTGQVNEIIESFKNCNLPLIIMGDFNSRWNIINSPLQILADELELSAYEPDKLFGYITLPSHGKRADWILISREFKFIDYRTEKNDNKSDHRVVLAKVGIKK